MGKEKFVYNRQTLQYEKVKVTLKSRIIKLFGFFSATSVAAVILLSLFYTYFPSPREKALLREIDMMKTQYEAVDKEVDRMASVLDNVQDRDAAVHRMVFGMNPIDKGVWDGGIGGHNASEGLYQYRNGGKIVANSMQRIELLSRQLVIQSRSLDTIQQLAEGKEKMLSAIPSIKPVREDKLNRGISLLSGFGWRVHPVYKVRRFHKGIDFAAPQGTPIQATGDGRVVKVERSGRGYGNSVVIDHGYGYQTLYGHMHTIDVTPGQTIKKGQRIGAVGDTGTSTAPHCHYEVHLRGTPINPLQYCLDGLSPTEYQELVNMAEVANQSLD
jgi:hypothetical protein